MITTTLLSEGQYMRADVTFHVKISPILQNVGNNELRYERMMLINRPLVAQKRKGKTGNI